MLLRAKDYGVCASDGPTVFGAKRAPTASLSTSRYVGQRPVTVYAVAIGSYQLSLPDESFLFGSEYTHYVDFRFPMSFYNAFPKTIPIDVGL